MRHLLPELPYPVNALEPAVSAETMEFHHGKHHRGYVEKLNQLIPGTEFETLPLEEIVVRSSGEIFNNAAQSWNHSFFWRCLNPGPTRPDRDLLAELERRFGSVDGFLDEFTKAGTGVFGSGWVWLTSDGDGCGALEIKATSNAENPLRSGRIPILVCDVWEHAYYIDYRNDRGKFLGAIRRLVDWEFASRNLQSGRAIAGRAA